MAFPTSQSSFHTLFLFLRTFGWEPERSLRRTLIDLKRLAWVEFL
uniref:Uncharacterized protein n=1 Tax=Lepeophtheirus salmonis TaxID=72036 RepID=A0A0K2UM85_LEPSM